MTNLSSILKNCKQVKRLKLLLTGRTLKLLEGEFDLTGFLIAGLLIELGQRTLSDLKKQNWIFDNKNKYNKKVTNLKTKSNILKN